MCIIMTEKIIPTKLENVFNTSGKKFSFDVNTPQFIKEACENSENGMYAETNLTKMAMM